MISVITAIHNGLEMNKVFFHYLKKYTKNNFELIIIDNASDDGSPEFFEANGAVVKRNTQNFSYPVSQNMGIQLATNEHLFFLNNDIIVSPNWDERLLQVSQENKMEVITCTGIERLETDTKTQSTRLRWSVIKSLFKFFPDTAWKFKAMHKLMYGNWETFCNTRFSTFGTEVLEGFVGNTVYIHRNAIEKIGVWDEHIQAADFDLYIRTKKRNMEIGDIKPCHIALGVFIHHFIKMTVKSKPVPFYDAKNLISLDKKWGKEKLSVYLAQNNTQG
ncbi:MAG: glycosyltransferase family 2 protein [Bacteroidetes bacterium]|nr:glycosyltransferase family 2 protein [Bacteroidota bacterium]